MVEDEQEKNDKEPKGEKEKGSTEVKEKEYEATSTEMLLLPFLFIDDDTPFTSATQLAQYVKVNWPNTITRIRLLMNLISMIKPTMV